MGSCPRTVLPAGSGRGKEAEFETGERAGGNGAPDGDGGAGAAVKVSMRPGARAVAGGDRSHDTAGP